MPFQVKIQKLYSEAKIPTYASDGDAGADLYSVESGILYPGERRLIRTGIAIEIPPGFVGLVHPRSGMAAKFGITIVNSPGTIDSGYRGEIMVNLYNSGDENLHYAVGDRIAQIIFQEVYQAHFEEVEELGNSARGLGGHGSTGVN